MKELLTKAVNRTQATILQGSCSTTKLLWHYVKYPHLAPPGLSYPISPESKQGGENYIGGI